jgi:integrase/recombinase XerC
LIGKWVQDAGDRQAVFVGRAGRRLSEVTARQRVAAVGKVAGVKHLHPHALRHAGAVHVLKGGGSVRHVQELLGHARLDTSMTYTRLVPADLKVAYDAAFPVLRV